MLEYRIRKFSSSNHTNFKRYCRNTSSDKCSYRNLLCWRYSINRLNLECCCRCGFLRRIFWCWKFTWHSNCKRCYQLLLFRNFKCKYYLLLASCTKKCLWCHYWNSSYLDIYHHSRTVCLCTNSNNR